MNKIFITNIKKTLRQPGIEPGSIAYKATMLTFTPPTLVKQVVNFHTYIILVLDIHILFRTLHLTKDIRNINVLTQLSLRVICYCPLELYQAITFIWLTYIVYTTTTLKR